MPVSIKELIANFLPSKTVILFGAGSTIPSGAPSVAKIVSHFATTFGIEDNNYKLSEIASLAEKKSSRHKVISELRKLCAGF